METTATLSANLPVEYYERKLLQTLEPRLVLQPLGKQQPLPKGWGKRVKWLRYSAIAEDTTPLTEGTPPSETSATTANVTADIDQYGQYTKVSDLLSMTAVDPVLSSLSERFGFAAAKTIEALIVAELDAEAPVQYVNDRADNNAIVAGDVLNHKECIEAMISQKQDFIGPHEKGDYLVVLHPASEFDILSDTQDGSFIDIRKFDRAGDLMNGEIGKMYGMRFLVSDQMTSATNASAVEVYNNYVIGEEAFGVVKLDNKLVEMKIKKHGSAGANDPLDQFATVGYMIRGFAAKYLDSGSKRVVIIRGSSAL
jgi:N4-gp56 family major capsid protein